MSSISSPSPATLKSLQQVSFSNTPNGNNQDVTITSVNTAKAWLIPGGSVNTSTSTLPASADQYLLNATTARFRCNAMTNSNDTVIAHSTVIEFN